MKLKNSKYKLLRFMNSRHGIMVRSVFALGGFLGTFILSRDIILARASFKQFIDDEFKGACRRAGWLVRATIGWSIVPDLNYNFTEGMSLLELERVDLLVSRLRSKKLQNTHYLGDQLFIWSSILEKDGALLSTIKPKFEDLATYLMKNKLATGRENRDKIDAIGSTDFSLNDARSALYDFANLFDINYWQWYIISGTFLGLTREGGFLKHDYDLDFGVNAETFELAPFLDLVKNSNDFSLRKVDYQRHFEIIDESLVEVTSKLTLIKLVHKTHINLDVFIHHLEEGVRWHGSSYHRWENKEFDLIGCEFEGVQVRCPRDADRYLTENYGDWRTPVTEFSCSTGTPNLVLCKNPSSVAMFLSRISKSNDLEVITKNYNILRNAGMIDDEGLFRLLI